MWIKYIYAYLTRGYSWAASLVTSPKLHVSKYNNTPNLAPDWR